MIIVSMVTNDLQILNAGCSVKLINITPGILVDTIRISTHYF